jgi:hypothetical protein
MFHSKLLNLNNSRACNTQVVTVKLYSLKILEEEDKKLSSSITLSPWQKKKIPDLIALIATY